uniref:Major facilitator superfamily (MFS) profile domain-containing protein n=1 Tax=Acrobeloides nanus TaxID=290746 RepID=A0A914E7R8_9BILA
MKISPSESSENYFTPERIRVVVASGLGAIFEWYDFNLYASLAADIGRNFYSPLPQNSAFAMALFTFAAGLALRPLGALIFGYLGDKIGRKYTFLATIVIMGSATFLVGILPTYDTIGVAAPVILIFLRCCQGLAVGGEYGGAATYVAEHAPHEKRGFYTGILQSTSSAGFFLAVVVIIIYFNSFDCNMVFHTGNMNPSDLSYFGPNLTEFGWKYTLRKEGDQEADDAQGNVTGKLKEALKEAGYPLKPSENYNLPMLLLMWSILILCIATTYGSLAAWLVELFPTRIRYTSMSLPYHIGNGWLGGFLPTIGFALVMYTGNIYAGCIYPIVVAAITFIVGCLCLRETKDIDIRSREEHDIIGEMPILVFIKRCRKRMSI